jgi:predicted nucleic acid-binding protein
VATRLLDTNIVSYVLKGHTLAARYQPHLAGHTLAIAFMTVAELYEGALRAGWGPRRLTQLEASLRGYPVIPADPNLCRLWGVARVQRRAQPISAADAWIAASALRHGCDLVTHNPTDFQGISGLTIITEAP